MKGARVHAKARQEETELLAEPEPEDNVGAFHEMALQKHASKALWRIVERQRDKAGRIREHITAWVPFHEFTPELLMCQGRVKAFVFDFGGSAPPIQHRREL